MAISRFLITILILFTTVALIWFFVFPKYVEFKNLQTEVALKEAEYNAKYAYYAEILNISNELERRKESLNKIDTALPDITSLAPLVYFLQKKTSESGLIVKDLFFTKASAISAKDAVKEVSFSLNINGNYSALKNFLFSLEKSASLFEVINISFGSSPNLIGGANKSMQNHSFLLEIKTHSY
ncbi:MAG: hypothetical protein A2312_02405 [Candidatus Staskawiczbacteria bacterium RIFOXYB2_FULL_32_9]|uniref:Type 4a pilus biogenesis protein PilO n=1 Tax=Candidatus Staskawiczbacteria bacterium RIFOXYD1_FULL_32_13 TaxID=1802234 RepID=A0A1G2JPZ1_9BACT|nr:MAG: hypothetical protein UR22_C0004G0042 [Parcubacteria group bacterium GW2011_GWC2_32_10]OGZ78636.1 MAG: hypothetical protein A2256_03865 [Candidatus Staskawiczbacteria bacterium RIFOXYA2_FULL_32_7]OGZ79317.1 MAG: hypothetical protein A2360_01340 [Candidatus Staskawiczbacteria bacterium RIFOXYB1_FULL_32_11]OGZ80980.1 MAG: hypothetical protein A2312_02405 [Candidatus Staskawiczbacteria bacterium RIFOXYB2_FULL_32_9]OGZ88059.1 MAG: hypothetical protein A2463_00425 [Candidatus Staskawiczbacter